jgi:hypothetical protein
MSPRRRDVLAAGGLALASAVAGCANSGGDGTENGTDDGTPGTDTGSPNGSTGGGTNRSASDLETVALGEELTVGDVPVTASEPAVRSALVYRTDRKQYSLASSTGTHYLLVGVEGGENAPAPDRFRLVTASSGTYRPSTPTGGDPLDERGEAYAPADGTTSGWLAFTVPGGVPYSAAVLTTADAGTGWALGEGTVAAMAEPVPAFSLEGVEAPDSVEAGSQFDVTVTVANTSDTDGLARGVVDQTAPSTVAVPFSVDVAAGETGSYVEQFFATSRASEVAFTVVTPGGDRSVSIPVEGGGERENGTNGTNASGNASDG